MGDAEDVFEGNYRRNPHQRRVSENLRQKRVSEDRSSERTNSSVGRRYTKDPDPDLLNTFDFFYKTTKSLLVLFQIMGIMPIERSGVANTTFKWQSKAATWAYIIFGAETLYVSAVLKERVLILLQGGKRFDEYIYGVIFISILIPHYLLPLLAWTNGQEVAKFKNMWTNFQYKYYEITGIPLLFEKLTMVTYSLCVFSWLLGIAVMMVQCYLQPDMELWHTAAYYHILAMLNCLCSLWYVNCTAKGIAARGLADSLHNALESNDPAASLADYREIWVDLSHMMQQLGRAYSGMYAMLIVLVMLTMIVACYGCLTEVLDTGMSSKELGLIIIVIYCFSLLFVLCNEAYYASKRMGPDFKERLLNVRLSAVDDRTRQEINMFLTAIDKNPPVMNLNQYADVNRNLVASTLTSMSTYLVMLMQFRSTLIRNAAYAARKARLAAALNNGTNF